MNDINTWSNLPAIWVIKNGPKHFSRFLKDIYCPRLYLILVLIVQIIIIIFIIMSLIFNLLSVIEITLSSNIIWLGNTDWAPKQALWMIIEGIKLFIPPIFNEFTKMKEIIKKRRMIYECKYVSNLSFHYILKTNCHYNK